MSGSLTPTSLTPTSPIPTSPTTSLSTTSSPMTSSQNSHSVSIGIIVGPVLGAVVLLTLIAAFFLCRFRRKNKSEHDISPFQGDGVISYTEQNAAPYRHDFSAPTRKGFPSNPVSLAITPRRDTMSPDLAPSPGGYSKSPGSTAEQSITSLLNTTSNLTNDPSSPTAEMRAIRQDLQQLMQLVARSPVTDINESPPEYV
jgi:hypothetical protein